jgi:hypothetical protein
MLYLQFTDGNKECVVSVLGFESMKQGAAFPVSKSSTYYNSLNLCICICLCVAERSFLIAYCTGMSI